MIVFSWDGALGTDGRREPPASFSAEAMVARGLDWLSASRRNRGGLDRSSADQSPHLTFDHPHLRRCRLSAAPTHAGDASYRPALASSRPGNAHRFRSGRSAALPGRLQSRSRQRSRPLHLPVVGNLFRASRAYSSALSIIARALGFSLLRMAFTSVIENRPPRLITRKTASPIAERWRSARVRLARSLSHLMGRAYQMWTPGKPARRSSPHSLHLMYGSSGCWRSMIRFQQPGQVGFARSLPSILVSWQFSVGTSMKRSSGFVINRQRRVAMAGSSVHQ